MSAALPCRALNRGCVRLLNGTLLVNNDVKSLVDSNNSPLNALGTTGLITDQWIAINIGLGAQIYRLEITSAAQALPGIVEPLDYDADTNARKWVQIL